MVSKSMPDIAPLLKKVFEAVPRLYRPDFQLLNQVLLENLFQALIQNGIEKKPGKKTTQYPDHNRKPGQRYTGKPGTLK
jgi:hypothetical protein